MNNFQKDIEAVKEIAIIPRILSVVTSSTGMRYAAVARVTETRWVACDVLDLCGFGVKPDDELPIDTTLCTDVRSSRAEIVIDDVAADQRFADHRSPRTYGYRSYASFLIILPSGELFGTLCAVDAEPRSLKGSSAEDMFRLFAELIAFHLAANSRYAAKQAQLDVSENEHAISQQNLVDSEARYAGSQEKLDDALAMGDLREHFIAVLGHDLRNPVASITAGGRVLEKTVEDQKGVRVLRLMGESLRRMSGLIDNLLDLARGRLGSGIGLELSRGARIEPLLAEIINEIKAVHPDREIITQFKLQQPVDVDQARTAQLLAKLLGNAITHGSPYKPIVVTAEIENGEFELFICNGGAAISEAAMERLFQPFYRSEVRASQQGLGLGLYISSEIAKAHGGTLFVRSDEDETCFTFKLPITE